MWLNKNVFMNKTKAMTFVVLICILPAVANRLFAGENSGSAETNQTVRLILELTDGSRVQGQPVELKWPVHTELAGAIKVDLSMISSIEIAKDKGWELNFRNGDHLKVTFDLEHVELKTSFGQVKIVPDLIRTIHVSSSNGVRHALKFNLSNRVEIPNDPALQFGDSTFTISFWFKTASERPYLGFISKRANSLGDGWVVHQDHGQLVFYCAGCSAPKSQPVSIRDNQWHHLLVTRSGGLITFYLDGKNVGLGGTQCSHDDNNPIRIGMDGDGNSWHFEGEISEVHIYGRTLRRDEVAEEWNNGQGQTGPVAAGGLIAGYHFDEWQGGTAKDFSGNNHNGMLINKPEWEY
jgi:hypothetical protein